MKYLKHLKEIKGEILYKTLEEQAVYADFVCVDNINNLDFIKNQMNSIDLNDTVMFHGFNTTSIGNAAFIALNAPLIYADKAKLILSNYKQFIELENVNKAQNIKTRLLKSIGFLIILIGYSVYYLLFYYKS